MLNSPLLLPKAIRKARQKRKWTQSELAKRLRVSQSTISFWERNIETPSLENLVELVKLLPEIFEQLARQEADILARLYQLERVDYGGKCSCQGCGCSS
jgi:transcriptional regulator with XRE-family HTH domain